MQSGKVYISASGIHGRGTFANRDIRRNETIGTAIEAKRITPFGKLINHSYCPNSVLRKIPGMYETWILVATKDIEVGTEVVADYRATPDFIMKPRSEWQQDTCNRR